MIKDLLAFQNTKCECGHQNPVGTVLCEACGNPLSKEDRESTELLEMRYDGMARRSQRSAPNIIDRIWNFFSSVKIAVYMIILTLVGSMFGTIFPQESTFLNIDAATYYPETYGTAGSIYYKLGLSHTYESWWFVLLLVMIGASLIICSLDRVLPLYKALSKRKIRKHMQFLTRQKVVYQTVIGDDEEEWIKNIVTPLKKKGYRVHTEGSALLAEKYRFSRWGPYVIHIGLIIFLLAVLARGLPGLNMDQHLAFPEGEAKPIPNTSYYLQNDKFTVEYYTEDDLPEEFKGKGKVLPKLFRTEATLFECTENCDDPSKEPTLVEVDSHPIEVNDPLNYKGLKAYQFDFDTTPILRSVTPSLVEKKTGKDLGQFKLDIRNPERTYHVGEYTLNLVEKYMDFGMNDKGEPVTISPNPNAPSFLFLIKGPNLPADGVQYFYFPKQVDKQRFQQDVINEKLAGDFNLFDLDVQGMSNVDFSMSTSYLNIRIDKVMPFIWVGAAIVMLGLILGFYWQHRRIWIRIDDGALILAAHTNKNWFGIRKEITAVLQKVNMEVDEKSLDNGGNQA